MAKLLLINISDPKSISRLVSPMNVHVETVSPAFFNETLERLASTNLSKKENIADLTLSGDSAFLKKVLLFFVMFPIKNLTKFFLSCVRQRFPSIIRLCLQIQVQNGV